MSKRKHFNVVVVFAVGVAIYRVAKNRVIIQSGIFLQTRGFSGEEKEKSFLFLFLF